jgi:membrane protease YdiL (CAAX protease family)
MIDPPSPKRNCPHCKSSEMEYYGFTFVGLHFYYKCSRCQKYTEYRIAFRNYLIMSSIILLIMVFSFAVPLSVLGHNSALAILVFAGSVVLFSIIGIKYRWYLFEAIALEDLPTDLSIIHVPSKKIRLIIIAIFIAVLFAYGGILVVNLMQQ